MLWYIDRVKKTVCDIIEWKVPVVRRNPTSIHPAVPVRWGRILPTLWSPANAVPVTCLLGERYPNQGPKSNHRQTHHIDSNARCETCDSESLESRLSLVLCPLRFCAFGVRLEQLFHTLLALAPFSMLSDGILSSALQRIAKDEVGQ